MNLIPFRSVRVLSEYDLLMSRLPNSLSDFDRDDFVIVSKALTRIYAYHCFDYKTASPVKNTYCCIVVKYNINRENKAFDLRFWLMNSIATKAMKEEIARVVVGVMEIKAAFNEGLLLN